VTPAKDLHIKSAQPVRPRIYLEGAAGVSSPASMFAFDGANSRRAADRGDRRGLVGALSSSCSPSRTDPAWPNASVLDKDGNALWRAGFQEMVELPADPPAPTADNARLFVRDNGSGKTQLCVRFNTGAVPGAGHAALIGSGGAGVLT
jgi:hypothetical protein